MSGNRFGTLFQYHTWGESHGPAIGVVVDGVPARLSLSEADIQPWLDRRRPGQSRHVTQRKESDKVEILSGVFDGLTTGAPVSLLIRNEDARPDHYLDIKDKYRPGHADYTYDAKYGHRDWRGGGRASARETACRVAAGAIARKILGPSVTVRGAVVQVGPHAIDYERWDWAQVEQNDFYGPDAETAASWAVFLDEVRKAGSSAGAVVEVHAQGVPAGWGAPVYDKLDADIAKALMSINAAKGVEIGAGFDAVWMDGTESADEMQAGSDGRPAFLTNYAGGILGGITTGQDVVARVAFKPTSSLPINRATVDRNGQDAQIATRGRHDPCVGIRGTAVAEAMVACVLADHYLRHRAQSL